MQVYSLYSLDLPFQYGRIKNLPEHQRLNRKISTAMDTMITINVIASAIYLSKYSLNTREYPFFFNLVCQPGLGFQAVITMRHLFIV